MKTYEIGFINGHSLRYQYETVRALNQRAAVRYLRSKYGSNFEHIITSVTERMDCHV